MAKMMMTSGLNYSILADRVVLFHRVVPDCNLITAMADSGEWRENHHDLYDDGLAHRYEIDLDITRDLSFGSNVLDKLNDILRSYASLIGSSSHDGRDTIIGNMWLAHVSRYTPGGRTPPHTDEDYLEDNGIYTCIVYLNDEYDGGEVGFTDFNVEVKPAAGDVLLFPSYYMHYGGAVLSGNKYMAISRLGF